METLTLNLEINRDAPEKRERTYNFDKMYLASIDYEMIIRNNKVSNFIITNVPKKFEYEISKYIFNCVEIAEKKIHNETILPKELTDYIVATKRKVL